MTQQLAEVLAGLDVRAIKLIALLNRERWGHPLHPEYSYKAIFACEATGAATARSGPETCGAEFFPRDRLPALSLARTVPAQIDLAFAHHAELARATDFD